MLQRGENLGFYINMFKFSGFTLFDCQRLENLSKRKLEIMMNFRILILCFAAQFNSSIQPHGLS